ncbi:MAG: hypothetical protein BWY75_01080 [bacterium ADurb.Bin425]|nr:MAG: hypothetical protein BWY75_01080 [bacterium ADurb.Bin425]
MTVFDDHMGARRQVVNVAFQYPDDTGAVGCSRDVALTVAFFVGLEALEHDTTGDIGSDIFGGALSQVLFLTRRIVLTEHLSGCHFGAAADVQERTNRDIDRMFFLSGNYFHDTISGGLFHNIAISGTNGTALQLEGDCALSGRFNLVTAAAA